MGPVRDPSPKIKYQPLQGPAGWVTDPGSPFSIEPQADLSYKVPMAAPLLKQTTLEAFQAFLNKYDMVSKKAFDFDGVTLFPAEIHTLEFIRTHTHTFVSQIAWETGITRGAASKMTVKLRKKGLIRQSPDTRNRSRQLLQITARGERACQAHDAHHLEKDKAFHDFFSALDPSEAQILKRTFEMMNSWMDNYL